jgi:hypothetical protein
MSKTVAMLTGDLLFASKVKSTAQAAGWTFYMGGDLPKPGTDGSGDAIDVVILDLSTRSKLVDTIMEKCRQQCADARVIAYGPHVHVQKLKAARDAGIPTVLTNGQLDAGLTNLFEA